MASKTCSSLALFLLVNLVFFSMVSAACNTCPGGSNPRPRPGPIPNPFNPTPSPGTGGGPGPGTGTGTTTCPRDALKIGACANVLNGLLNLTLGQPPVTPCCTLIRGLVDLEAAICLCTAIRASTLGINININLALSLLLNVCSRKAPRGFQCP